MRILILGGPRVGKTTLAGKLAAEHGIVPLHTDDLIGKRSWSEASDEVRLWLEQRGPFLIEGIAVVRALRKYLAVHPEGAPADALYIGTTAREALTPGQASMTKGHERIWSEVRDELARRGLHPIDF